MRQQEEKTGNYRVWVGERDRIASFHEVEGYRPETFVNHDLFIQFLRQLQEKGFRFQ